MMRGIYCPDRGEVAMRLSELNPDRLSKEQITSFMFDETRDNGNCGDCILVFGAKTIHRVEKAAKLYHDKRAPSILVTGSAARWGLNETPEAIWMKDHLTKLGVPEKDILIELEASNTTENVIASMMVLQQKYGLHTIKRLLIVSSPFHMKRCLLTLRTYMPDWITYTYCSDDRKVGQRDNWWTDSTEKARVIKEVHSISKYAGLGIIEDVDIPSL